MRLAARQLFAPFLAFSKLCNKGRPVRLEPDPNFALLRAAGRGDVKWLRLSERDKATLKAAQKICQRAADLLGDDEGIHADAAWRLDVITSGF